MNVTLRLTLQSILFFLYTNAAAVPDVAINYDKFKLVNGLTVIVHEDRKAPIVQVSVFYKVGMKDEPEGKTEFAHLFEHLMFKGSENYDRDWFGAFEAIGATAVNGTTRFDRTNFFQTVPTPALDMTLWLESDRMGYLLGAVTQEKLDNVRSVVQNERRQRDNEPYGMVKHRMLESLFPEGHPYRYSINEAMRDLENATLEDVHQWFKDYYGAANAVLVLAGDIDTATAKPLVEKYFGDVPAGPPVARIESMIPDRSNDTLEIMYDRVPLVRTYRYWAVPGHITRERHELELAAGILGGGKNSRLYQSLVQDSQLATSIAVSIEEHQLASIFSIEVTVKQRPTLDEVNRLIDVEMSDFLQDGPSPGELERARTSYNASIIRGFERIGGSRGKANALAEGELYAGDPAFYYTSLERINSATPQSIRNAAAKWLSKGRYQLEVLPFGKHTIAEKGVDRTTGLPPVGHLPDLQFPEIRRDSLSNGLEVVLAERHAVPIINIALQFDAGYAADSHGKLGASSFAMAMLNEGTTSRSAMDISAEAELLGANILSDSNLDMSTVSLSALKDKLKPSVDLFADIVLNPAFSETDIERLRDRWTTRIAQEKARPIDLALRILPPLLYGKDHAYGIPQTGSGTEDSISILSRQDLVEFHRAWIRPSKGTLFVVGDTSMDEILPVLENAFGKWRDVGASVPSKNLSEVSIADRGQIVIVDKPGLQQSLILGGHLAPPTGANEDVAIQTMNDILGGGFTGRVNMNLREEKGWAYGANTGLPDARGQRIWFVYAPVQTDRTADSIKELIGEFDAYLGDMKATDGELAKSIQQSVNSLPGQFETGSAVLESLLSNRRFGRGDEYVESLAGRYLALDLDDVHDAAADVIRPNRVTWLVVGDREKIEAELIALRLGPVSVMDADGNIVP